MIYNFLTKHNTIITLSISVLALIATIYTNDNQIFIIRCIIGLLIIGIVWQIVANKNLNKKLEDNRNKIEKLNNKIDNFSLEVVNRFRYFPNPNVGLQIEELIVTVKVIGKDIVTQREYKGRCINKDGEDSLYVTLSADSNSSFDDSNFRYFDLINCPDISLKATHVQKSNNAFGVKMRLLERLNEHDSFHVKYSCEFKNCMDYEQDYYTVKLYKNIAPIKKFQFFLYFANEKPDRVEAFDATQGGESKFIKRLSTRSVAPPYLYEYIEDRIAEEKDIAFNFKRI